MWQNIWLTAFFIALGGNIFGWGVTILRILQNLDGWFGKLCLIAQIFVPAGVLLAFIFGWKHSRKDDHWKVMLVWTCSVLLFATLPYWEPPVWTW